MHRRLQDSDNEDRVTRPKRPAATQHRLLQDPSLPAPVFHSWAAENLEEFWTDTIVDSEADYFIGAVIVFETGNNRFDVVDGQQRLTTLTIMLAALRDAYDSSAESKLASGLHMFVERPNVENDNEYVLQTETSYPYFHEHIQKHAAPDSGPV